MSRWHEPFCKNPDVVAEGETPYCRACDSRCPLQQLLADRRAKPSPLSIPPDEPPDKRRLWWPSSVPYTDMEVAHQHTPPALSSSKRPSPEKDTMPVAGGGDLAQPPGQSATHQADKQPPAGAHPPIYPNRLGPDEIRFVCLPAAENSNSLIHLSLETFNHANCPEYETTSYTWGGENGDYDLCWPVFVGPYWDVAFQTKNCVDMLRFLQPWRGVRLVWVDALCINQADAVERGEQVAKMGQIYKQSSRVVVYLGPDAVSGTPPGRFPPRRPLHELETHTHLRLEQLLARRYFSRVWVIQELLLSERAVIHFGDTSFLVDAKTMQRLADSTRQYWSWDATAAPWFQYAAKEAFDVDEIYDVLRLTSGCEAADHRDRLFAVLGLVESPDTRLWQLDYSLSVQHVLTGLFAHLILRLKKTHLLVHAAGLSAPRFYPSWMPDLVSSPGSWQRVFAPKHLFTEEQRLATGLPLRLRPRSGALCIHATHHCIIPSRPIVHEKRDGALGLYEVRSTKHTLMLVTREALDEVIQPGNDHLFSINKNSDVYYFILRRIQGSNKNAHQRYRVVAYCFEAFLYNEQGWMSQNPTHVPSVYEELEAARRSLSQPIHGATQALFPDARRVRDTLPAFGDVFSGQDGASVWVEASSSCYLATINSRFQPRVVNGYVELTIPWADMHLLELLESRKGDRANIEFCQIRGGSQCDHALRVNLFYWWDGKTWTSMICDSPLARRFRLRLKLSSVRVRAPVLFVRSGLRLLFENLIRIQHVLRCTFEEFMRLLLVDGPKDEHYDIGCPELGDLDELCIDGSTFQVCIL
ncbi:Heterokaryon incompatibility [Niveomyces insectorum RCEF 264]|uniref:Heterokaryon incompatibility n=1 Tax=Niveomyces insectorum RCEF 264 TaxID=1081102 RepID=A0A167VNE8_9HYPO|nr:Heterokaryon incompatibility [Niveomyces insectorum RCEF 264]